jgi:hypothetical protein
MLIDFERIQNHKLSYEHGFPVFKKIFFFHNKGPRCYLSGPHSKPRGPYLSKWGKPFFLCPAAQTVELQEKKKILCRNTIPPWVRKQRSPRSRKNGLRPSSPKNLPREIPKGYRDRIRASGTTILCHSARFAFEPQ